LRHLWTCCTKPFPGFVKHWLCSGKAMLQLLDFGELMPCRRAIPHAAKNAFSMCIGSAAGGRSVDRKVRGASLLVVECDRMIVWGEQCHSFCPTNVQARQDAGA